jgi:hypothetical protein
MENCHFILNFTRNLAIEHPDRNHRIKGLTVGNHWQVDKQPAWLVAAIKKAITDLPGGYAEALNGWV